MDSLKEMANYNVNYDSFICGSDQIWNPYAIRDEYFLRFVDKSKRKVAYAVSIARDTLSSEEEFQLSRGVLNSRPNITRRDSQEA